LWQQARLNESQLKILRDPAIREVSDAGIAVHPPDHLVESLSAEARAAIYNLLGGLPGNSLQQEPFRFRADMVDEWFADAGISEAAVARVRGLLYPRGNALLFSDPNLVLPLLPTARERVTLIKTLARKSTLLLKLRIRPDSDIEALAAYWSTGRRRKDVKPLLRSLSRHPDGLTLDVVHLLPRFPRGIIYTYPAPDIPPALSPDCHWTSMNFFNELPDQRFDDIAYLKQILLSEYAPAHGPNRMGDILLLTRADGEVIHSCVYVAADIVFTKNGRSQSIPWTLTTIQDLQAFYPANPTLQIRGYRKRN
jgi:hypothetical protein